MSARPISAGDFRHRLTVSTRLETPDGAGGMSVTYEEAGMIWAALETLKADARARFAMKGNLANAAFLVRKGSEPPLGARLVQGENAFVLRQIVSDWPPGACSLLVVEEIQ